MYSRAAQTRFIASLAACFLVMLLGIGGCKLYFTPVSYMSIDINPSIQLSLNIFSRVIDASAFNEDGERILDAVSVKNDTAEDSVREIIACAEDKGYLSGSDKSVIVNVLDADNNVINTMSGLTREYSGIDLIIESADKEDKNLSDKMGISIGRAHSLRDYAKTTGETINEISDDMKYADIMEIKEKSAKSAKPQTITQTAAEAAERGVLPGSVKSSAAQTVSALTETAAQTQNASPKNVYKKAAAEITAGKTAAADYISMGNGMSDNAASSSERVRDINESAVREIPRVKASDADENDKPAARQTDEPKESAAQNTAENKSETENRETPSNVPGDIKSDTDSGAGKTQADDMSYPNNRFPQENMTEDNQKPE